MGLEETNSPRCDESREEMMLRRDEVSAMLRLRRLGYGTTISPGDVAAAVIRRQPVAQWRERSAPPCGSRAEHEFFS